MKNSILFYAAFFSLVFTTGIKAHESLTEAEVESISTATESKLNGGILFNIYNAIANLKGEKGDTGPQGDIGPQGPAGTNALLNTSFMSGQSNSSIDLGSIPDRNLTFVKTSSTSKIRITYSDILRVRIDGNGTQAAHWTIYLDGNPTSINTTILASQSTGDINIHRQSTIIGYLEDLPAGTYNIDVRVGPYSSLPTADAHTGLTGNTFLLEALEVE